MKFRTIDADALGQLGEGPSHIKRFERAGQVTRVGEWLKNWYLDELPQILNIVAGDMFVIGTRPYPLDAYEAELDMGRTRKYEMPGGLVGPVQSYKGVQSPSEYDLDLEYWEAFATWSPWSLLKLDGQILRRSVKVQLAHEGR
ncbi:UDP-galactose-lipid carrier transferase [Euzebya pacifica]|uniref:UDP-galactose-lipid carrier transferase n=1 Tax=Euzebya pacifica TaxID=1608957 RepID=A0A346XW21_9ACTN|nr:UDP-galactose-lipid carrier transferase [Euzebya pacifica]